MQVTSVGIYGIWDSSCSNDREKMTVIFAKASFQDSVSGLGKLMGSFGAIITNQFVHMFDWEGQVSLIKKVVELSRPGTMLIGCQRA